MKELFEKLRKDAEEEFNQLSEKEKANRMLASFLLFDKMQSPYDNAMSDEEFEKIKSELEKQVEKYK